MSSNPSLSVNPLLGTLSCSLTPHMHLTILISASWSVTWLSFLMGQQQQMSPLWLQGCNFRSLCLNYDNDNKVMARMVSVNCVSCCKTSVICFVCYLAVWWNLISFMLSHRVCLYQVRGCISRWPSLVRCRPVSSLLVCPEWCRHRPSSVQLHWHWCMSACLPALLSALSIGRPTFTQPSISMVLFTMCVCMCVCLSVPSSRWRWYMSVFSQLYCQHSASAS